MKKKVPDRIEGFTQNRNVPILASSLFDKDSSTVKSVMELESETERKINLFGLCRESEKEVQDAHIQDYFNIMIPCFMHVFGIENFQSLEQTNESQKAEIRNYNAYKLTLETNVNHFCKSFTKMIKPALKFQNQKESRHWMGLIIEEDPTDYKHKILIMNKEGFVLHCLCNLQKEQIIDELKKEQKRTRGKKMDYIICYSLAHWQHPPEGLIDLLYDFSNGQFAFFSLNRHTTSLNIDQFGEQKRGIFENKPIATRLSTQGGSIISTHSLTDQDFSRSSSYLSRYVEVRQKFQSQIRIRGLNWSKNEKLIQIYGMLYNLHIHQNLNAQDFCFIQKRFLKLMSSEEAKLKSIEDQYQLKKKYGHYPEQIQMPKVCCYCKTKKSSFRCQQCTFEYRKDIVICAHHFHGFHSNIGAYLPKGLREKAKKNLQKKMSSKVEEESGNRIKKEDRSSGEEVDFDRYYNRRIKEGPEIVKTFVLAGIEYYGYEVKIYSPTPFPREDTCSKNESQYFLKKE